MLKLLSSMATKDLLQVLARDFERAHALNVVVESVGGVDVGRRVRAGEAVDAVVLAANTIDQLGLEGHLLAGCRFDIAQSGIAVAIKTGARSFDLSSETAVKQAILQAKTVSYSTGPSGVYLESLFAKWDITEQIKARVVLAPPGVPVGSLVGEGKAELGFQQLSELISMPGITVIGALPTEIQLMTTFSAGISKNCQQRPGLDLLLNYLCSPETASAKERSGMQAA
jgi:molybdate transport system substrate-binding protein